MLLLSFFDLMICMLDQAEWSITHLFIQGSRICHPNGAKLGLAVLYAKASQAYRELGHDVRMDSDTFALIYLRHYSMEVSTDEMLWELIGQNLCASERRFTFALVARRDLQPFKARFYTHLPEVDPAASAPCEIHRRHPHPQTDVTPKPCSPPSQPSAYTAEQEEPLACTPKRPQADDSPQSPTPSKRPCIRAGE